MPLPPSLAAKLAKRGIITPKHVEPPPPPKKIDYKGLSLCPNKCNVFHDCTVWCENHWKTVLTPEPRYVKNMQKILSKFILPSNWTEVYDKGIGRYYYWNMENDLVSWLPPLHPKSFKSLSAARLREKLKKSSKEDEKEKRDERESGRDREVRDRDRDRERERDRDREKRRDSDSDSDEDHSSRSRDRDRRDRDRDDRRYRRDDKYRGRKPRKDNIDPMDPAAYSDIPVGKWSDGLENNQGRADSTASGVLFQQRPYPAPGEILASNKEKEKKK